MFAIRRLADQQLIGEIDLDGVLWTHGECFVGIGLGDREFWGKGYGTDAMRVILKYAFFELNLNRVSLTVFEYNPRARRSYEKEDLKKKADVGNLFSEMESDMIWSLWVFSDLNGKE